MSGAEPEAGSDQGTASDAQDTAHDTASSAHDTASSARDQGEALSSDTGPETSETPEAAGRATAETGDGPAGQAGQAEADGASDTAKASSDPEAESGTKGSRPAGRKARRRGNRGTRFLRELVILIVVALVIAVAVKTYAIQAFFIPSGSMQNTLEINDRVLVNKLVYDVRGIHRGDIVVFNGAGSWDPGQVPTSSNFVEKFFSGFASMFGFGNPGDILIKRVIGLPGDHVACCNSQGQVTVNGVPLTEQSYLYPGDVPSEFTFNVVVPAGRLWVMGDHRSISDDSRDHMGDPGGGSVPESAVLGRAFVIIWPPSHWRILPIPATFEQPKLNSTAAGSAPTPAAVTAADESAATAGLLSARLAPSAPALPLSIGFAAAIPVTWLRRRVARRRAARRGPPQKTVT
jgi:signal peptidase I